MDRKKLWFRKIMHKFLQKWVKYSNNTMKYDTKYAKYKQIVSKFVVLTK